MSNSYRLLIIGATGSGIGKTSISCGLIYSLRSRGYRIQPFKIGPDFLDPSWLTIAAKRQCISLDSKMTSQDYVKNLVDKKMQCADIGIIEGVMGLYDGAYSQKNTGSTAEIARLLSAPVVLIANAHGAARSFAATIFGFSKFPDSPDFAGVIANHCGSKRHLNILSDALESVNLPPLLGGIPKNSLPSLPSRHLGLISASKYENSENQIMQIAEICEKNIDIDNLISAMPVFQCTESSSELSRVCKADIKIAYASDNAFHFYYQDNLDLLITAGAELVPFSPLNDSSLPPDIDGIYFGGGYPEEYTGKLSANKTMIASINNFINKGKPVYAECGGFMYLCKTIKDRHSQNWNMADVFPFDIEMTESVKTLGYCDILLNQDCIIGKKGMHFHGHEFHYSEISSSHQNWLDNSYKVTYSDGRTIDTGFTFKNVLASYIHLHWGETPTPSPAPCT
jgi:cobyrinic acid a,c-diamide synthase